MYLTSTVSEMAWSIISESFWVICLTHQHGWLLSSCSSCLHRASVVVMKRCSCFIVIALSSVVGVVDLLLLLLLVILCWYILILSLLLLFLLLYFHVTAPDVLLLLLFFILFLLIAVVSCFTYLPIPPWLHQVAMFDLLLLKCCRVDVRVFFGRGCFILRYCKHRLSDQQKGETRRRIQHKSFISHVSICINDMIEKRCQTWMFRDLGLFAMLDL